MPSENSPIEREEAGKTTRCESRFEETTEERERELLTSSKGKISKTQERPLTKNRRSGFCRVDDELERRKERKEVKEKRDASSSC